MECLAHHACKTRPQNETSSLELVKKRISIDPKCFKSTVDHPVDPVATLRRTLPSGRSPHVCVVGAGMAGLRCATQLSSKGFSVTVLEARDRVGGRVHQIEQSGHLLDMGPNWIHGSRDNPILELAHRLKDTYYEPPEGQVAKSPIYSAIGVEIDNDIAMEHSAIAWNIVDEAIRYSQADKGASIPPEKSLLDYFEQAVKVRGYGVEKARLILDLADMWSNIVGEPIHMQSLRYMWLEACIEGENWFLASTYKNILDNIARDCMDHADLHLNKKVTRIISRRTHDHDSHPVLVVCEDGTTQGFDEIVVTVPLGWLKKHHASTFAPPLPSKVATAISHIGYGRLEKVYVSFTSAFWQTTADPAIKPFIFQFLTPEYAPEHNPERWTIECVSLAALYNPHDQATLLFYINGPTSKYVTNLVSEHEQGSRARYTKLQAFFSPYYSRLPNFDPQTCEPISFYSTNWQNDELAGYGSYSTYQVSDSSNGLVELDNDIERVRIGCPERNLWFAGEHTAPTLALGTTTGAYWSGERVADQLEKVYGF